MLLSEAPGLDPANANIFSSTFPEEIMGDLLSRMVSIHVDKNEFVYKVPLLSINFARFLSTPFHQPLYSP